MTAQAPTYRPLDVRCPRCGAIPGQPCTDLRDGRPASPHVLRQWHARHEATRVATRRRRKG